MKIITAALAVICATLAVLLVTQGSSSTTTTKPTTVATAGTTMNTTRVANSIRASILAQRSLHSTVQCPGREPQEVGVTFTCTAMTHRLSAPHAVVRTPFVVTVQSSRGYATYVGR
jgi:hypothetical protein